MDDEYAHKKPHHIQRLAKWHGLNSNKVSYPWVNAYYDIPFLCHNVKIHDPLTTWCFLS
jgi:hypothetical protein